MEKQLLDQSLRHSSESRLQMLEVLSLPGCSQMRVEMCRSECLPDVTGITSCTSELIHDTRTDIERHGILHTELNVLSGNIIYSKILMRGPESYPTGFQEHGESLIQDGGFWLPAFSGASSLSLSNFAQIWCPCVSVVVTIISITKCLSCVTSHLSFCLANDLLTSVPG